MTCTGSTISVKRGCTDKVPCCRADDDSGCIHADGLVHIHGAAIGHDGLAAVGSAGSAGKLEIGWDCGR